jgi:predicted house-cleaning NTP pyrophosphatase (Maf/HAM1 superfamily)
VQLTRLDEAGMISIEKTLFRKTTRTTVKLTKPGKEQLSEYWRTMKKIQEQGGRRLL